MLRATRALSALAQPRRALTRITARNKSVAGKTKSTSGQIIGVKALLYLVLAVATVVLAVLLLSRIYNTIIGGGDPAAQDAKLLAQITNDLLKDERRYVQVPVLLRVDGERIVAFGNGEDTVDVPRSTCKPGYTSLAGQYTLGQNNPEITRRQNEQISVSTGCKGRACICSSSGNSVDECHRVTVPDGTQLVFGGNYQGYSSCLLPKSSIITEGMPAEIKGQYTEFVVDKTTITYPATTAIQPTGNNKVPAAIIPVIIEKIPINGGSAIVISPDGERVRGREYYLYTCPEGSLDDCAGKTGAQSMTITQGIDADGKPTEVGRYCAPSLSDGKCSLQTTTTCGAFCGFVNEPCLCAGAEPDVYGKRVATYGFCSKTPAELIPTNCDFVSSCDEYCEQDGDGKCTSLELTTCSFDACGVAGFGKKCEVGVNNGFFSIIGGMLDSDAVAEKCVEATATVSDLQRRAAYACG